MYDPGKSNLIPKHPHLAFEARHWNNFLDSYWQVPMQKIVSDFRRPDAQKDSAGVNEALQVMNKAYDILEKRMQKKTWLAGDAFTLADCAAAVFRPYVRGGQTILPPFSISLR